MQPRLAIEIGGTKLQAALGTADGKILASRRCAVPAGSDAEPIRQMVLDLAGGLVEGQPLQRVGIGFGGPVDAAAGQVVLSHHVAGWEGFGLRQWAAERFAAPCVMMAGTLA